MNRFARMPRDKSKYGKRHKPGEMNATESAYAEQLQVRKLAGEIIDWCFERITLKLADNTRYTPDFVVWLADETMEFVDTKPHRVIDPKSLVKVKVAAEQFCWARFVFEERLPKKLGGGWKRTEF